jgi:thiosulfate/3-mercaptopyruvate sulfurtransferase
MLQMPAVEQLQAAFEKLGISDNSRIILYFGKDWISPTGRVFLTLEYLGLGPRASILDGGMSAWRAAGGAVTSEVRTPAPGKITPHTHPDLIADVAWVSGNLNKPGITIIDARTSNFYGGADAGMPRAGHIPGATNIPFTSVVEDSLRFKDRATLAEMFRGAGVKQGDLVVTYCHIGQQASLVWFIARYLGYEARMYDGSFEEWSARQDLPVVTSNTTPVAPAPKN